MFVLPILVLLSLFRIINVEDVITVFRGVIDENALELIDESDRVNVRPHLEKRPDSRLTLSQALIGRGSVLDHPEALSYLLLQLTLERVVYLFFLFGFMRDIHFVI